MKVKIDFSIFTCEGGAFGSANGILTLLEIPNANDAIYLEPPFGATDVSLKLVSPSLDVKRRIFGSDGNLVILELNDLTFESVARAEEYANYLEIKVGLYVDRFG